MLVSLFNSAVAAASAAGKIGSELNTTATFAVAREIMQADRARSIQNAVDLNRKIDEQLSTKPCQPMAIFANDCDSSEQQSLAKQGKNARKKVERQEEEKRINRRKIRNARRNALRKGAGKSQPQAEKRSRGLFEEPTNPDILDKNQQATDNYDNGYDHQDSDVKTTTVSVSALLENGGAVQLNNVTTPVATNWNSWDTTNNQDTLIVAAVNYTQPMQQTSPPQAKAFDIIALDSNALAGEYSSPQALKESRAYLGSYTIGTSLDQKLQRWADDGGNIRLVNAGHMLNSPEDALAIGYMAADELFDEARPEHLPEKITYQIAYLRHQSKTHEHTIIGQSALADGKIGITNLPMLQNEKIITPCIPKDGGIANTKNIQIGDKSYFSVSFATSIRTVLDDKYVPPKISELVQQAISDGLETGPHIYLMPKGAVAIGEEKNISEIAKEQGLIFRALDSQLGYYASESGQMLFGNDIAYLGDDSLGNDIVFVSAPNGPAYGFVYILEPGKKVYDLADAVAVLRIHDASNINDPSDPGHSVAIKQFGTSATITELPTDDPGKALALTGKVELSNGHDPNAGNHIGTFVAYVNLEELKIKVIAAKATGNKDIYPMHDTILLAGEIEPPTATVDNDGTIFSSYQGEHIDCDEDSNGCHDYYDDQYEEQDDNDRPVFNDGPIFQDSNDEQTHHEGEQYHDSQDSNDQYYEVYDDWRERETGLTRSCPSQAIKQDLHVSFHGMLFAEFKKLLSTTYFQGFLEDRPQLATLTSRNSITHTVYGSSRLDTDRCDHCDDKRITIIKNSQCPERGTAQQPEKPGFKPGKSDINSEGRRSKRSIANSAEQQDHAGVAKSFHSIFAHKPQHIEQSSDVTAQQNTVLSSLPTA